MDGLSQQLFAILAVLGLLFAGLWLLRRFGLAATSFRAGKTGGAMIEVLARQPLTAQHSLHVVRVGTRTMLIGVSPQGCTCLEKLPPESIPDRGGAR